MRLVFMGTPDFAVSALNALYKAGHEIAGVFTRPDMPKNRGMRLLPTPVKQHALTLGIEVYQPKSMRGRAAIDMLKALEPETVIVAAYGLILPQQALDVPRYGCLNIHASLLPKYRGASPINTAIMEGERESGVTIMRMDAGLDTGDMLMAERCEIAPDETAGMLHDKLAVMGGELIVSALRSIESGEAQYTAQPVEGSYARMIGSADCAVDFSDARRAADKIRGLDPVPGAYAELDGQRCKLFGAKTLETDGEYEAGLIEKCDSKGAIICCARGKILLAQIQPAGKKRMTLNEFLRGKPSAIGKRFNSSL